MRKILIMLIALLSLSMLISCANLAEYVTGVSALLSSSESSAPPETALPAAQPPLSPDSTSEQTPPPTSTSPPTSPLMPAAPIGIAIGEVAPDFTLDLRGGGSVTLWELHGKPVFLNVFTTWCPPCQIEFPDIQKLFEIYGDEVHVIAVSIGESQSEVDGFFDRHDYTFPVAYDPNAAIDSDYNITAIPQTWVLDANGVIVDYHYGGGTFDAHFEPAIKKAIG